MAKGVVLTIREGAGSSQDLRVYGEDASGLKNNSNTVFNTSNTYESGTLCVYYNGQRLNALDFVESDVDEFQLIYIKPYDVDKLTVDYLQSS